MGAVRVVARKGVKDRLSSHPSSSALPLPLSLSLSLSFSPVPDAISVCAYKFGDCLLNTAARARGKSVDTSPRDY
jgi:hypothetical protein